MSQMYNVAVPQGYGPGMQFQAQVGGQMQLITVPQGAGPGSVVQVAGPPLVAQATPVPQAQPQVAYAQPIGQQQPAYGYGQQQPPPPQPMGMTGYGQASPEQPPPYPVAPQAKQQMANQPKGVPPPVFLQPTHALQLPKKLERLYLGLGWRSARQGLDLDASAIIFSRGQKIDTVNFQKLRNVAQGNASIVHTGDVLTGQQSPGKMEDLERIYFWVPKLERVDMVYLVVNVFTDGATFSDVQSAYCRMVNADTEQEIGRFQLENLHGNAVVFARIEKHQKGHWQWVALGQSAQGRTAHDIGEFIDKNPAMNSKPSAYENMTGAAGTGAKPTKQKPSRSWVAPAMIGATAAGIAAATLIYTQPQLRADMMGGVRGGPDVADMMDLGSISPPEMPIDIDLTPPEGIADAFGEFAGRGVEAGGAFVNGAGNAGGQIVSAVEGLTGWDMGAAGSAIGDGAGAFGDAVGSGAGAAAGAFNDSGFAASAGGAFNDVGNAAGDAAGDAAECCEGCCGSIMGALSGSE